MTNEELISYLKPISVAIAFVAPSVFYIAIILLSKTLDVSFASKIISCKQYFIFFPMISLIAIALSMLIIRNNFPGFSGAYGLPPRNLAEYFMIHANECGRALVAIYIALYLFMYFIFGVIFFSFILFIG